MLQTGEGNGTPLQYSCLENPMDGGASWVAVHGVAKSQTPEVYNLTMNLTMDMWKNTLIYSHRDNLFIQQILIEHLLEDKKISPKPSTQK